MIALLFLGIFVEQAFAQGTGTQGDSTTGKHSRVNISGNATNGKSDASASASASASAHVSVNASG